MRPIWLFNAIAIVLLTFALGTTPVKAEFPDHPLRLIMPFSAGGNADITARILAEKLSDILGERIVVENVPGPGGAAAARAVLAAPRDGYTLMWLHSGNATGVILVKAQTYDPLKDFTPVSGVSSFDLLIAAPPSSLLRTFGDLLSAARKNPGKLNAGTVYVGGSAHLTSEYLKVAAGLNYQGVVYRSEPDLAIAARRDDVQFIFDFYSSLKGNLEDRSLIALASTGLKRTPFIRSLPTVDESGVPGFNSTAWNAIYVASGTPKELVDRLSTAIRQALTAPEVKQRLFNIGVVVDPLLPEEQDQRMRSDIERWRKIIAAAGIQPF